MQYAGAYAGYGDEVEEWRQKTVSAGRPLTISMDELATATPTNSERQRKAILWPTYLSGGQLEWYVGGEDQALEDFRTYERLWEYTHYARSFVEENLPFWEMEPRDGLLSGESSDYDGGQVFVKPGELYAVYLPNATSTGSLDLSGVSGEFQKRWFNPRTGTFEGVTQAVSGGGSIDLDAPPNSPSEDWVALLENTDTGQSITSFTLIDADTDQPLASLTDGATINLATLLTRHLNVRADTSPAIVGSVRFVLDDQYRTENTQPYALAGDLKGDYLPWVPVVGSHTLTAVPYPRADARGMGGTPLTVNFTVVKE